MRTSEVKRVRKKPVEVTAQRWDGTLESIIACCNWVNGFGEPADDPTLTYMAQGGQPYDVFIWTLEGEHRVSPGDWIIRGVQGEFYPCKPGIFAQTYEVLS